MQCSFTKLSGSDLTVTFELYNVSTEGLIDKFTETAKNFNGLRAIMEKRIPDGFMKIPGAAPPPQAETTPLSVDGGITSGVLADSRDGKKYKTVKIGNQIWMAENLNYAASGSKCYDNKPENCAKYGRLYNWYAAMNACPSGWHLPSNGEYETLDKYVGGEKVASLCPGLSGLGACALAASRWAVKHLFFYIMKIFLSGEFICVCG